MNREGRFLGRRVANLTRNIIVIQPEVWKLSDTRYCYRSPTHLPFRSSELIDSTNPVDDIRHLIGNRRLEIHFFTRNRMNKAK